MSKFIPLSAWAKKNGISIHKAYSLANRGRLQDNLIQGEQIVEQKLIRENAQVPEPLKPGRKKKPSNEKE